MPLAERIADSQVRQAPGFTAIMPIGWGRSPLSSRNPGHKATS